MSETLAAGEPLSGGDLEQIDQAFEHAFATGDESGLRVLGYGEISTVVAWPVEAPRLAVKRLPVFGGMDRVEAYRETFFAYLDALSAAGIRPVESQLAVHSREDGTIAVYCVQPILPAETLATAALPAAGEGEAGRLLDRLVERITGAVGPRLGLDGQLSNWATRGDDLVYLDVTTPLLRDDTGRDRLDTDLFLSSLPWALRPVVRRMLLRSILDKYYEPRGVLLDLAGNLLKEDLRGFIPPLLDRAAGLDGWPITEGEVERYYRSDARTWAFLQRVRRVDRAWQRRVRRRAYPFLLPGRIQR
jgi:hypothetical protein